MNKICWYGAAILSLLCLVGAHAQTQTKIVIPAGTPEDQAINAISNEPDIAKRAPQWQDFVQKFSGNPQAVAFGNWQLAQAAMAAGKPDDALAFGDKALASMPTAVDILVSQVDVAQQAKKYGKVMDYATRGAKIISGLPAEDKKSYQNNYEYLEAAGYNAIMSENDPQARLSYVEPFEGAFPNSRFETAVTQQAFASLQQMGDPARTYAFGEHVLQGNPNSVPTLITLADAYAEDVKTTNLPKAITYAKKAIELTKPEAPDADQSRRVLGGFAYSVLGYALLKQDKAALAVSDLKSAVALLKEDPSQQQIALYRLGFAYAKLNKLPEAKEALTQAVAIDGPMKDASKDLLSKVSAARPKPK